MRILLFFFSLFITAGLSAQIKSGQLIYQMYTENNNPDAYQSKAQFVIKFNEQFIWYGKEDEGEDQSNWNLEDKISGINTICNIRKKEKYVQFFRDQLSQKEEEYQAYDDYYDNEPDLETYHEDYYKDLMKIKIPVKDTVVEKTEETKEILGFVCKKTILKIRGEKTVTVWSTEDFTGLESLFKLGSVVPGAILSYTSEDEYGKYHLDAVNFDQTVALVENELYQLPTAYYLCFKPVYIEYDDETSTSSIRDQLKIPSFIVFVSAEETVKKIIETINGSVVGKEDIPYAYLNITVHFDQKGTVTNVEFEDDTETDVVDNIDRIQLSKEIKKNCHLQKPITLNGKKVPAALKINYAFYGSDY